MTTEQLLTNLAPTSTSSERVRALLALFSPQTLSQITGAQPSTVRNWGSGKAEPRHASAIAVDDLRMISRAVLEKLRQPARVTGWLTSRDPELFHGTRPIEMVCEDPMEVLAAAQLMLLDEADVEDERHAERRADMCAVTTGDHA